jgi:hypothetical protein
MANPWFRLYSECYDDFKMISIPEVMRWRYVALMCLQCSETLKNLPDAGVALKLRISLGEVAETKAILTKQGFIKGNWELVNWDKRQFLSDSSTERQRKHRAKLKAAEITRTARMKRDSDVTVT